MNFKHTNGLTLELISTRKELILANNAVTSLQKYLGENDPHINVYRPQSIPVDEDLFSMDGSRRSVHSSLQRGLEGDVDMGGEQDSSKYLSSSDRYPLDSLSRLLEIQLLV